MIGASVGPLAILAIFALCLRSQRRQRAAGIKRLFAGPRPKPDSWHPAISVNGDKRHGATTIGAPVLLVLMAGMFLLGAWSRERSYESPAVDGVNAVNIPDGTGGGRAFDDRLAELKTRPTLANVTYFRFRPLTNQRQEVIDAMRAAANDSDRSIAQAAQVTLHSWEK